jgi:enoyl-CoA hydratase/carnithine racemase
MSGQVTLKYSNGIAFLSLRNPGKLNAISQTMLEQLIEKTREIEEDPGIRVVILQGSDGNFSSGADIEDLSEFDGSKALGFHRKMNAISHSMRHSSKIYIALLEGFSLGGGFELSLSADLRICSEDAKLGQPEINIGLNAGAGGNVILPRFIGRGNAMYYILTGEKFDARKGLELGLIQKIVSKDQLYQVGEDLARRIISIPEKTVELTKMTVNASLESSIDNAMDMEALVFSWLNGQEEIKDKIKKFLEK